MLLTFFEVFGDPLRDGECTILRQGEADIVVGDQPLLAMVARAMVVTIKGQEFRLNAHPGGGICTGWVNPNTRRQRQVRFAEIVRVDGPTRTRRIVLIEGTLQRGEAIEDIRPDGPLETLDHDGLVCFGRGARILTAFGELPVEDLRVGDLVHTIDNGLQPVRWVGSQELGPARLYADPELAPVRISRNALGPGLPAVDITVSPQHRMLVEDEATLQRYGSAALAPAAALVNGSTITRAPTTDGASYHHVLFDEHELVFVEGAPSESFYPTPVSLAAMTQEDRNALLQVAPQLDPHPLSFGPTVRPCIAAPQLRISVA